MCGAEFDQIIELDRRARFGRPINPKGKSNSVLWPGFPAEWSRADTQFPHIESVFS